MLCVPARRFSVKHAAVRRLPVPVNEMLEQPAIVVPPSRKFTVPVGALPLTVAVNVTVTPSSKGVCDVARLVVLDVLLIVCERTLLVEAALAPSPL